MNDVRTVLFVDADAGIRRIGVLCLEQVGGLVAARVNL